MTAKQTFPDSRRQAFLTGLADEQLARDDAAAALLSAAEAAKEAETKRRIKLGNEVIRHRKARLEAVGRCEQAAVAFTDAVKVLVDVAENERRDLVALGEGKHADLLNKASLERRISRYLSHQLRSLSSPVAPRFGDIGLASWFRPSVDWRTAEARTCAALAGKEGNGGPTNNKDIAS